MRRNNRIIELIVGNDELDVRDDGSATFRRLPGEI
jgi:hypothetical protein